MKPLNSSNNNNNNNNNSNNNNSNRNKKPFLTAYEFENNYDHKATKISMEEIEKLNEFSNGFNYIHAKPKKQSGGKEPWNLPYAIYLANPAKTFISNIYRKDGSGYNYRTLLTLLDQASKLTPNPNQKLEHDDAYIYELNVPKTEKVIFLGDHHGSFHAFFRNLLRWYVMGLIDDELKIKDGYRIIFCGDIVDRGQYALDILIMIWQMMIKNNTNGDYKVIINRGNHENERQWQDGLNPEIIGKYSHVKNNNKKPVIGNVYNKLMDFFTYCPSAVLVNFNNEYKIFACHGFYPFEIEDGPVFTPLKLNFINNYQIIPYQKILMPYKVRNELENIKTVDIDVSLSNQLRWNDIENQYNSIAVNSERNVGLFIPFEKIKEIPGIDLFIRGHQDNNENTVLLTKPGKFLQGTPIKNIEMNDYLSIFDSFGYNKNTVCILDTNMFQEQPNVELDNNNNNNRRNKSLQCEKVITISTNSDQSRTLNFDSFIVFEFLRKKEDFNRKITQNINKIIKKASNIHIV